MKKHWYIISVSALLAVAAIVGTVFALMRKDTPKLENEFVPAVVQCEVHEALSYTSTYPEYVTEHANVRIKNTGNIDSYLRIRFVSYWVKFNTETTSWEIAAKSSVMPELNIASGWIAGDNYTYYYPTPVAPDAFTTQINTAPIVLQKDGDYIQVLEVFGEAIQALPTDAVVNSWHVVLSGNTITGITTP